MHDQLTLRRFIYYVRGIFRRFYSKQRKLVAPIQFGTEQNRIQVLQDFVTILNAQSYLEIGCADDEVFSEIDVPNKVGVDPVRGGNYRGTSDNFFQDNKQLFDLIFIDGMHTFSQVYRDVENSLNFLKEGGVIILHDMLPKNYEEQLTPCATLGPWTGDVWKLNFLLNDCPEIRYEVLNSDHGLGIIRTIEQQVILPKSHNYSLLEYKYYCENIKSIKIIERVNV